MELDLLYGLSFDSDVYKNSIEYDKSKYLQKFFYNKHDLKTSIFSQMIFDDYNLLRFAGRRSRFLSNF